MNENEWRPSSLIPKVDGNIFQGNPLVLPVVEGDNARQYASIQKSQMALTRMYMMKQAVCFQVLASVRFVGNIDTAQGSALYASYCSCAVSSPLNGHSGSTTTWCLVTNLGVQKCS